MGMYTRLTLWVEIPKDSPAVPILQRLVEVTPQETAIELPSHPFFSAERWRWTLVCSSYYHQTSETSFRYDEVAKAWFLNVDSSLKDYGDEISLFLDWLAPYLSRHQSREFIGFHQYEEDEHPTLLYFRDGKIEERAVS